MSGLGQAISVLATAVAFVLLLGPMFWEEVTAAWYSWQTPVGVCRGCGCPMPLPEMHTRCGVPFCCLSCADEHPTHHPEELDR